MHTEWHGHTASGLRHALGEAGRWLLQCIERFPIPIEEALWIEAYGSSEAARRLANAQDIWEDRRHVANPR
ncbi:MAG: hypothetical protein NTV97_16950 [Alphaproteobacteria bacterium]|nr:hypothetical protein [Alphaproteobacteria bacterium]